MDIIKQFLEKYELNDDRLVNYNIETIDSISKILNRNYTHDFLESKELHNNIILLNYLGLYYNYKTRDLNTAKKYYLLAIDKNCDMAMNNLGVLHMEKEQYVLAEMYFMKAVEKNNADAMNGLGILYKRIGNEEMAEKYYLMAIEKMTHRMSCNLGLLYHDQKKYDLAEKIFLMAVERNNPDGLLYLKGLCYSTQLKMYHVLVNIKNKNDLINKKINELKSNKKIIYYENKKVNMTKIDDCSICFENTKLIPRKCAHYYCYNCYVELNECAICRM